MTFLSSINWSFQVPCQSSLEPGCLTTNPIYVVGGVLLFALILCLAAAYGDAVLYWVKQQSKSSPGLFWGSVLVIATAAWLFFQILFVVVIILGALSLISLILGAVKKNKN